jgi:succinate dehydrogenase/fumarate reductase flavoprotein subunit
VKKMKFKIALAAMAIALVTGVLAFAKASPAKASTNLNDLLVTNGLFTGYNAQDLAGLIAVDNTTGGSMSSSNLNDLIVMNGLFTGYNAQDLAGLIAVEDVTGGGISTGGSIGHSDLTDLIVLGGIFDGGFHNNANDLAALIAVDNMF